MGTVIRYDMIYGYTELLLFMSFIGNIIFVDFMGCNRYRSLNHFIVNEYRFAIDNISGTL